MQVTGSSVEFNECARAVEVPSLYSNSAPSRPVLEFNECARAVEVPSLYGNSAPSRPVLEFNECARAVEASQIHCSNTILTLTPISAQYVPGRLPGQEPPPLVYI